MKSNSTLAFCCNVNLLIESKEFERGSPTTTHQPSSRFYSSKKEKKQKISNKKKFFYETTKNRELNFTCG